MIIDIHNHADYHGMSAAAMVANMDAFGIDKTVLLSWEAPVHEYSPATKQYFSPFSEEPIPFSRCLAYADRYPERFELGFCPDPRRPDAIQRLRAMAKLYPLRLCGELKLRMMYDNPDAIRLYREAGALGLPVLMHFDYEMPQSGGYPWGSYWYGGGIDVLERVLKLCPDTDFLGHAPGFWAHISADEQYLTCPYPQGKVTPGGRIDELLHRYPNLYCDISAGSGCNALKRDPAFGYAFLTRWQDRVLFARDAFDNAHRAFLEASSLSKEIKQKIYEGNARKILRDGATL